MSEPIKEKAKKPATIKKGEKKLNIHQRLFNAQEMTKTVLKLGRNETQKYNFAREQDVLNEAKPVLHACGILMLPPTVSNTRPINEGEKDKEGRPAMHRNMMACVTFTLVNVDNPADTIVTPIEMNAGDTGDKVITKIITMARKYFLMQALQIPTGDDGDSSDGSEKPEKKGKEAQGTAPQPGTKKPGLKYEEVLKMIEVSNNKDGLIEFSETLKNNKAFTTEQKKTLNQKINTRVDVLDSK